MNEAPTPADKRMFLIVAAVLGLFALSANCYFLATGELELRLRSRETQGSTEPALNGRLDTNDLAFYPLCITWVVLSLAVLAASAGAAFTDLEIYGKVAAWSLAKIHPDDAALKQQALDKLNAGLKSDDPAIQAAAQKGLESFQPPAAEAPPASDTSP